MLDTNLSIILALSTFNGYRRRAEKVHVYPIVVLEAADPQDTTSGVNDGMAESGCRQHQEPHLAFEYSVQR